MLNSSLFYHVNVHVSFVNRTCDSFLSVRVVSGIEPICQAVRVRKGCSNSIYASFPRLVRSRVLPQEGVVREQQNHYPRYATFDAFVHRSHQSVLHLSNLLHGALVGIARCIRMKYFMWCCGWFVLCVYDLYHNNPNHISCPNHKNNPKHKKILNTATTTTTRPSRPIGATCGS